MSLFLFAWAAIGLFLVALEIQFLNNTNPRMMDFFVDDVRRRYAEKGREITRSDQDIEYSICAILTIIYLLAWPLILYTRNR